MQVQKRSLFRVNFFTEMAKVVETILCERQARTRVSCTFNIDKLLMTWRFMEPWHRHGWCRLFTSKLFQCQDACMRFCMNGRVFDNSTHTKIKKIVTKSKYKDMLIWPGALLLYYTRSVYKSIHLQVNLKYYVFHWVLPFYENSLCKHI